MCPIGYFTLITWKPKVWAVALYKTHYSTKVINNTDEFVLCLPAIQQVDSLLYCGSVHGWKIDKAKNTNFKFTKSNRVKPPIVEESIACFECKVIGKHIVHDHTLFLGEVVESHISEKDRREKIYNWDDKRLGTIKLGDTSKEIQYSPEGE